jgi:hypothetical protein
MTEVWRDIPGYEGRYQVSDLGNVRNRYGRVMRPQKINSGYLVVHLCVDRCRKIALVHRLVALVFCQPGEGDEVNHIDADKLNNVAANLEWCSRLQNVAHSIAHGRRAIQGNAVVGRCLQTGAEVRFETQIAAERALAGKQTSAIHYVVNGKRKSAYGYAWRLEE